MANYVRGLGGNCCDDCAEDNPCSSKPVITVCGSGTAEIGVFGTWAAYSSGSNLTGASWSMLPFDGLSINSSTGFISGTVPTGPDGIYYILVTATNACGSASCSFELTLGDVYFCDLTVEADGGDEGFDRTFDVTGDFTSDRNIFVDFETFTVKDRLIIYANGVSVYDSGCISGSVSPTILIPAGTTSARVQIIPNCEGTSETIWTLSILCA